jgi:hypothetical protein
MKPDIKEIAYRIYEESLREDYGEVNGSGIVEIGGIYLTVINKKPVYYVVVRQVSDNYFEALKMTSYYEFATDSDIFYKLDFENQLYIIETALNFYLTKQEIENSVYIESINEDFIEKILLHRDNKKTADLKTGFEYPFSNKYIKKFKEQEFKIIKDYHLRIFEILDQIEESDNIIEIAPERLENYKISLAASSENKTALGDDFILYREKDFINIILPNECIGKKIAVVLDGEVIFEGILNDNVIALSVEDTNMIDLDKLAKSIKVEVIQ